MAQIDLNCDLGESFGRYSIGNDLDILPLISSANVACGFHAGDFSVMARTVALALENETAIGAHPGLPDLQGFGRRKMEVTPEDIYDMVVYQIGALQAVTAAQKGILHHVKPHGALYHMASEDSGDAEAVVRAITDVNPRLLLFAMAGSRLAEAGERSGLHVIHEVYADRTYQPDGSLTPRSQRNALITDTDQAIQQVLQMVLKGSVTAVNGDILPIQAETICVHGDGRAALAFVERIRKECQTREIEIKSWN
ncbi:MAG: 5-oxoprolinase subunit PxpA [Sporolactobacillus sp.]